MDTGSSSIANVLLKLNFSLPPRRVIMASTARMERNEETWCRAIVSSRSFAARSYLYPAYLYPRCLIQAISESARWFYRSSLLLPSLYLFAAFSSPPTHPPPDFLSSSVLFRVSAGYSDVRDFIRILLDCRDRFH